MSLCRRLSAAQPLVDELHCPIRCALLLQHKVLGSMAELRREFGIRQAAVDERFEVLLVADDDGGGVAEELSHHIAKVPSVRAEGDGSAIGGRLDHVLAAAIG